MLPGCVSQARIVSFAGGDDSYIAMSPVNVNLNFEMSMRVRSTEDEGIIFYAYAGTPTQVRTPRQHCRGTTYR